MVLPKPTRFAAGDVDVVVTDGFSGNIALKAVEGTARFVADLLRRGFSSSLRSKIGFLISRPATELLKHHLDPNNHNGAVFLGLNGIVVKSHGSANAAGVANAVAVTARLLEENVTERITADLARVGEASLRRTPAAGRARLMLRSVLMGTGSALPRNAVSNAELAERVDTSDEWIVERTGICQRYIAEPDETTSSLATQAARAAIDAAGLSPKDIDLIVLATATPDQTFPATRHNRPGQPGLPRRHCVRRGSGLFGLSLCSRHCRFDAANRHGETRTGDRRRNFQPHSRLGRPRPLACCLATVPARLCSRRRNSLG